MTAPACADIPDDPERERALDRWVQVREIHRVCAEARRMADERVITPHAIVDRVEARCDLVAVEKP